MSINLTRNSRLFVSTVKTGWVAANTWEIPLMEGFSFSQSTSSSDVSVNEAGPTPTRGSRRFNESLDPVEWSFGTYIRPYISADDTNKHHLVDEIMWHGLVSGVAYNATTGPVKATLAGATVAFTSSQFHELTKLQLYFKVDNAYYHIEDVQVGQAEVSVDIDGIGMTNWSGQGVALTSIAIADLATKFPNMVDPTKVTKIINPAPNSYLKNKLSLLDITTANGDSLPFSIPITGASFTINNNITYLTPSTLAEVDRPIGSFTGGLDITGSFDGYLNTSGATSSAAFVSYYRAFSGITNANNIVFKIGGPVAPNLEITIPRAQVNVPEINMDDVVGFSTEFKAIGTTMGAGDEATLKFLGAYTQPSA